jgi:hypothetical protein
VGTFQIVNGQKQGGNVASYFCLGDGSVLHAIPGQVQPAKFLSEARWAYEVRKAALTSSTDLVRGEVDARKYRERVKSAHLERYSVGGGMRWGNNQLPNTLPRNVTQQTQVHWLLATRPMPRIDDVYPIVWERILNEKLSTLPVERQ